MKDPQDCTYPQEALCLHDCKQECQKRSGWRKKQIDDAEEEAWKEMEKKNKAAFKSWFAWYTSPPENWNEKYGSPFVWTAQEKALMQRIKGST
jgi:hypothetical protein